MVISSTLSSHKQNQEIQDRSYSRKLREASAKFQAEMLLLGDDVVVIPTAEEWVGINLLERDGEI
jgi:hypothetical protein